ncbi:MAG: 3-deoxy-D-manno-octulosonic acid transferase, partial [Calditrichia bacterium]
MTTTVIALIYNLLVFPLLFIVSHIAALFNPKIREGMAGRYRSNPAIRRFVKNRVNTDEVFLIHCASMGEFEHIKPFIRQLKQRLPHSRIVVMFFSPSGFGNVKGFPGVALFIYSPFDWWFPVVRLFKTLHPSAFIIAKHDVWPNQVWAAHRLGIPVFLINASLHGTSSRLKPFGRLIQRNIYKYITKIIAISAEDKENFRQLAPPERIIVAGDTKYEQVIYRMEESRRKKILPGEIYRGKTVLVAGSIWPEDEAVLIPALKIIKEKFTNSLFILCPHEPTPAHLEQLRDKILPLRSCLYSSIEKYSGEPIIVIDRIGLLANLYSLADVAYVGGSFKQNIHNVLEAAVYGIPVLFGPVNQNSREAQLLKEHGGAREVKGVEETAQVLGKL